MDLRGGTDVGIGEGPDTGIDIGPDTGTPFGSDMDIGLCSDTAIDRGSVLGFNVGFSDGAGVDLHVDSD